MPIRGHGGFTFAETPDRPAPVARLIWHADIDPGTLPVVATAVGHCMSDAIDPADLAPWLTIITAAGGRQHAVLSDGWRHIRLDIAGDALTPGTPVMFDYCLHGLRSAERRILPLRRFLHLCRHRRFAASLFPADPSIARGLIMLQVWDALQAGASQREIAAVLFGAARVDAEWRGPSESLRSRVRRLVRGARHMAAGGYRSLLRDRRR